MNRAIAASGFFMIVLLSATIGVLLASMPRPVVVAEDPDTPKHRPRPIQVASAPLPPPKTDTELMLDAVHGQVLALTLVPRNIYEGRYEDELSMKVRWTVGAKSIAAMKGRFVFRDAFGDLVATRTVKSEHDMATGVTETSLTGKHSRMNAHDVALAGFDLKKGSVAWEPLAVIFADGSKIVAKEIVPDAGSPTQAEGVESP